MSILPRCGRSGMGRKPVLGVHHVLLSSSSTRHRGRQDLTGVLKFPSDEGQPRGEEVLLKEGRMCVRRPGSWGPEMLTDLGLMQSLHSHTVRPGLGS
jgi:hypothetical protein